MRLSFMLLHIDRKCNRLDSRSWLIPMRLGMEESSRSGSAGRGTRLPNHSGRGAEPDRMRFGAIAVFAFVRILLFLAAAAGARQLTTQGRTPLSATPLSRAAFREK